MNDTDQVSASLLLPFDNTDELPVFWVRVWQTLKLLLVHPIEAINRATFTGKDSESLSFLLALTWPVHIISESGKFLASRSSFVHNYIPFYGDIAHTTLLSTIISIAFFPIGLWITYWLSGLIYFVGAWIWSGFKLDFGIKHISRVMGFICGALSIIWIPISLLFLFRAPIIALKTLNIAFCIWSFTWSGMGVARACKVSIWRGIAASATILAVLLLIFVFVFRLPLKYFFFSGLA